MREGGSLGSVILFWSVSAVHKSPSGNTTDPSADVTNTFGTIQFSPGQLEAVMSIGIKDDPEPELDEMFLVQLVNVSQVSDYTLFILNPLQWKSN